MRSGSQASLLAGVHVGGTKILAGIFDRELKPLACAKLGTQAGRGPEAVVEQIARAVRSAAASAEVDLADVSAVGLGVPGAVNPETGTVRLAVNLGWIDFPVREQAAEALGTPVVLDNDANLSLLGIFEQELRREPDTVLGVFIGSGIGGALITEGRLYEGDRFSALEIGHMILNVRGPRCACGRRGCFEALASRTAIFRDIRAALRRGKKTVLAEMLGPELEGLRSGHLRKALRRRDPLVRDTLHRAAEHTGVALSNLTLLYDPALIVLGGGLMEALGPDLLPVIQRLCGEMLPKGSAPPPPVILSSLADNAGIMGGAIRAREWAARAGK